MKLKNERTKISKVLSPTFAKVNSKYPFLESNILLIKKEGNMYFDKHKNKVGECANLYIKENILDN